MTVAAVEGVEGVEGSLHLRMRAGDHVFVVPLGEVMQVIREATATAFTTGRAQQAIKARVVDAALGRVRETLVGGSSR
jgi:hypothetical protein